jgi:hypothetical protein
MTQTLTSLATFWRSDSRSPLRIAIDIDHGVPGSHLIWHIENAADEPVTLTRLLIRGANGTTDTVPLGLPHVLAPSDHLVLPTDVDWSLLNAKSVAAVDVDGREYHAPQRQLAAIRAQMRDAIARPADSLSAHDFLSGAADLAFGVAILGLGLFMLMYAIATG